MRPTARLQTAGQNGSGAGLLTRILVGHWEGTEQGNDTYSTQLWYTLENS